jgi:hypothetical protein
MTPFDTRLVIAAVLGCAAIILAFIYRRNLKSEGGQQVAVLAVVVAIVGMPVVARAIERLL